MKRNEAGFAHLQLLLIGLLVVGAVSFAAFRVGQNSTVNRQADEISQPQDAENIKVSEKQEETQKEVELPTEEKEIATVNNSPPPEEAKVVKKEPVNEVKKEDKVYLTLSKVSAVQEGSKVRIHTQLPSAQSGTCSFKLWQDGYEKVYSSVKISNSADCIGELDIASLPTYSGWELHAWFDGSDGKTFAYMSEEAIALSQP